MARRQNKKVGIFDFTGNPITYGHLLPAERMTDAVGLDEMHFTVSRTPPNKKESEVMDADQRHELTLAATADNARFFASRVNLRRRGVSYSVNTVEGFLADYPYSDVHYLLSGEYLDPNHKWWIKHWTGGPELFKLCKLVIFPRYDQTVEQLRQWAKLVPEAPIQVHDAPSLPISATLIRGLVAEGRSIRYLTPEVVRAGAIRSIASHLSIVHAPPVFDPLAPVEHVGVFFADFDPVTLGDLRLAEVARERYGFDRVEFVPAVIRPDGRRIFAPAEARYDLLAAGTSDNEYFTTSRFDIERGTVSHPLLTLHQMRQKYGPEVELTVLFHAEQLDPSHPSWLGRWMGPQELFAMANFVALPTKHVDFARASEWAKQLKGVRLEVLDELPYPVDAADIRQLAYKGRSIAYTTPRAVEHVISKSGLYLSNKSGAAGARVTKLSGKQLSRRRSA